MTRFLPLSLALAVFSALVLLLLGPALRAAHGRLIYALDDAYIHMAMARSLAFHANWGLTPDRFTNASSSPLWTLILAAFFRLGGARDIWPFVLNLAGAVGLLLVADRFLRRSGAGPMGRATVLVALVVWTPLPVLAYVGQEHTLHALLSIAWLGALLPRLGGSREDPRKGASSGSVAGWFLLTAALTAIRLEGLFLAGCGSVALFATGRRRLALGTLAAAVFPIGLLGGISVLHGGFLLPNPVLLKGNQPHLGTFHGIADFARQVYRDAVTQPYILALLLPALGVLGLQRPRRNWSPRRQAAWIGVAVFAGTLTLHLQFARLGWFFRYEAYLVALGLASVSAFLLSPAPRRSSPARAQAIAGPVSWTSRIAMAILALFAVSALSDRAEEAIAGVPRAIEDIWRQPYQTALLLKSHYPEAPVALNDLGLACWLTGVKPLDLWGLASPEVARSRRSGRYDREEIARLAQERGIRIAALYPDWFEAGGYCGILPGHDAGLPSSWIPVGWWEVPERLVLGGPRVVFYAVGPGEAPGLEAALKSWGTKLPEGVRAGFFDPDSSEGSSPARGEEQSGEVGSRSLSPGPAGSGN